MTPHRRSGAHPAVAAILAGVAVVGAVIATWTVARSIVPGLGQPPATPCTVVFSQDRCFAIRADVATALNVSRDAISTIDIVSVRDAGVTYLSPPGFLARVRVGDTVSDVPMCRGVRITATAACPMNDQYP